MKPFQIKFMLIILRFVYNQANSSNSDLATEALELHDEIESKFEKGELE